MPRPKGYKCSPESIAKMKKSLEAYWTPERKEAVRLASIKVKPTLPTNPAK